jgi:hypothetical protein
MLFCSSSNLAAVRWLLVLGASHDACDTNGTTCLHAACRSGSIAIVRELIVRGLPLSAADVTGWTALHIAAFMGRRAVGLELMQNGADLQSRTSRGLLPLDLCSDGWLREAMYSCGDHRERNGKASASSWRFGGDGDLDADGDIQVSSRLRFEPFFVPRVPVIHQKPPPALQRLGTQIFNRSPGQGLAFLVSTGSVRDFPIELSTFLLENDVSPVQVGEFLGEDFSLAQTLRLEFINSVRLTGTGVVSCMAKVFDRVHIPSDMRKIDRLLEGVAQIWWRQHERLQDYPQHIQGDQDNDGGEVEGLQLMRLMPNHSTLHQLMFSTVLLHWSLYAPLPPSQRIKVAQWLDMNAGLGGCDVGEQKAKRKCSQADLKRLQCLIYSVINRAFLPQLQIWNAPGQQSGQQSYGKLPTLPQASEAASDEALESWARLVGGGFPSSGLPGSTVTYRHVRSIHCETTTTDWSARSPVNSRPCMDPGPPPPAGANNLPASVDYTFLLGEVNKNWTACGNDAIISGVSKATGLENQHGNSAGCDTVWLTLRDSLLMFAKKPQNWIPYAFLHLPRVTIGSSDPKTSTITLTPLAGPLADEVGVAKAGVDGSPTAKTATVPPGIADSPPQVQVVFLLPDGRWQAKEVPHLEVQLFDSSQHQKWIGAIRASCSTASNAHGEEAIGAAGSDDITV